MRSLLLFTCLLLGVFTLGHARISWAQGPGHSTQEYTISAARAGLIARRAFGGRVIDVKKMRRGKRHFYRVKLLQANGRIHSVLINARTGQILQ